MRNTPELLIWVSNCRRVVGYFPKLKVIFLARDPVKRVWSHLSIEVHYG